MKNNGRPSEYSEDVLRQVDIYLSTCRDRKSKFHKTVGLRSDTYEERITVKLPSVEGFAKFLGVSRKTIYNWSDTYEEFAEKLDEILSEQKIRLISNGLAGMYNPIIAKLILSSNHGMRERVDATTDDKPLPSFSDEQVNRIAQLVSSGKGSTGGTPGT